MLASKPHAAKTSPPTSESTSATRQASEPAVNPVWAELAFSHGGARSAQNHPPAIQRKVEVGPVDDSLEREADAVAARVMNGATAAHVISFAAPRHPQRKAAPEASAMHETSLSRETLGAGGSPLPHSVRQYFEPRFERDLSAVRVHADAHAEQASDDLHALAFTFGSHVWLGQGQSVSPTSLLAHELVHVVQQTSPPSLTRDTWTSAPRPSGRDPIIQRKPSKPSQGPYDPVLMAFDVNLRGLESFLAELAAIPDTNLRFKLEVQKMRIALVDIKSERDATQGVALGPAPLLRGVGADEFQRAQLDATVRGMYGVQGGGAPSARNLGIRRGQLERGATFMETVRARVLNLINSVPADAPPARRDVAMDVASFYLQTATLPERDALAQLGFLESFYADDATVTLYAAARQARLGLSDLTANVKTLWDYAGQAVTATDLPYDPQTGRWNTRTGGPMFRTLAQVSNWRDDILGRLEEIGDPPSRSEAAHGLPTLNDAGFFAARLAAANGAVAVLALWIPTLQMEEELGRSQNAGTSLWPGADDRDRWSSEISMLKGAFSDEVRRRDYEGLQARVEVWEPQVKRLLAEIPPELRRRQIMAAIAEQIPFLFVGGGIAGGVGRFVGLLTESRWLIALAEGVTLTGLGALATPRASQPKTVGGWALQLGLNVGLARIGRALFEIAGDISQGLSNSRGVITRLAVEVGVPLAGLTTATTAIQALEQQATQSGGETNLTELFTINLILNSLGLLCGAATRPGGTKPTAAELARKANINEEAAQRWLALADRSAAYMENMRQLQELARRGQLTSDQFAAMKAQGFSLADELERALPDLARALELGVTPEQIRSALGAFRARLGALSYSARPTVTRLLPQYTGGLQRVDEVTYVYDAQQPPKQLPALRAALAERYNVRPRPSGGFEALDPGGKIVAQVLPAGKASLALLPRSLNEVAKGPQAQAGLARVRAQTVQPILEAQLAQAAGANPETVVRVLRVLGRTIEAGDAGAWNGLSRFFSNGGDVEVLSRVISHPSASEDAAEAGLRAQTVLRSMAIWDASAARGLGALYQVRPRLTSERAASLFFNFEPVQVRGIFQSLDLLASRSRGLGNVVGPLTSESVAQQRGAMGALTSGVQLAEKFPGRIIAFETPVYDPSGRLIRVQDINVIEEQATRVAGVEKKQEVTLLTYEVKEISTANLGSRGPHQLAVDIVLDSQARAQRVAPAGGARPFFETFRWRIRRSELAQTAADELGITDLSDLRVDVRARDIIERLLRPAFTDPVLKSLSPDDRTGYEAALRGVPFVELF